MTKNIWIGLVALVLVVACGICEVVAVDKAYQNLAEECQTMMQLCLDKRVTATDYQQFRDKWLRLREFSELLLPHVDVYEINLRFAEGQAYAQQGDFEQLYAQFCVISELLDYVPHLTKPNFRHVV